MEQRCKLLLVEDSEDDVFLFQRGLARHPKVQLVARAENGEAAIDYLSGIGAYANRTEHPLPDAIVVDLKMPRRTGFELLAWMQGKPGMPKVAVFSSSDLPEDRQQADELGAILYQAKTYEVETFDRFIHWVYKMCDGCL